MRETRPTTRPLRERGESAMRARERRARMRALARRWAARRLVARESRRSCEATRRAVPVRARREAERAARSTTPNSVTNVAPPSPELGLPAMTPKPISRYAGMRMLARWPGEFIQAAMMAFGLASSPVPQARFSPIRQAPPSDR